MTKIFLIFLGGGLGAVCRYLTTTFLAGKLGIFPLGTFAVNIFGSFLMGIFLAFFLGRSNLDSQKIFITVGFLGGFTTFSSFSADTFNLIQSGNIFLAVLNILLSVAVGLFFCIVGFKIFS